MKYSESIIRGMDALNIVVMPGVFNPETNVEAIDIFTAGVLDTHVSYNPGRTQL